MKYIKMRLLLLLYIIIFFGCSDKNNYRCDDSVQIDLSYLEKRFLLSSFVDEVSTIKVEVPSPYFFGIITEISFTDSTFFVIDKKQESVFRFKQDGTFINKIGNKGEAPGEYYNMHRFFIGEKYVFISDLQARKIHYYTHDGEYVKTISNQFSLVYNDIVALPNGKFLCHDIQGRKGEHKIWLMNEKGEKEKTLLYHSDTYPYSNTDKNTIISTTSSDRFKIFDPITGILYLYEMEGDKLREIQHLVSDRKGLIAYKGIDNLMDVHDEYAYIAYINDTDNYLYSMWYTSESRALCSLYNKKDRASFVFKMPKMDFPGFPMCPIPISTNVPNALIAIMTDEYPLDYFPEQYKNEISEQVAVIYIMKIKS